MEYKGIITLDPGHGGKDSGAVGINGSKEKDNTLSQSLILKNYLEKQGFKVYLTRSKDEFIDLNTRKNIADNYQSDLLISIHNNSFADSNANGIESWNYPNSISGRKASEYIHGELIKETNLLNRGNKETKSIVLTGNSVAVLVGLGFISNEIESKLLANRGYQNIVASAITKGVCKYFNVPYISAQCDCAAHGTVTVDTVTVRGKLADGKIVGELRLGDRVSVIAIAEDLFKIIYKEHVAYVNGRSIKID